VFNEMDKDGKIDQLFNPAQRRMLRDLYDAVGDIRSKPKGYQSGSDTAARAINMVDSVFDKVVAKFVPYAGKTLVAGKQWLQATQAEKAAAKKAATTPLEEAAESVRAGRRPLTLRDMQDAQ
jgi:hypothetical protein